MRDYAAAAAKAAAGKQARRPAAKAPRCSAAAGEQPLRPRAAAQPRPREGSCARAEPWPDLALPAHAKPPPLLLPPAGLVSAVFVRRRLGGDGRRRPPACLTWGGDGDDGGASGGSAGPCLMRLPNLHTAEREYRARLYRLLLRRSGIAQLGVYTTEYIMAGELVIEYCGELVRRPVADARERAYAAQGDAGACYMFAIDADHIVDATRKGNLSRFINHSCSPNCKARIVEVDRRRRVFYFASRQLAPGEELTIDYCLSGKADAGAVVACSCRAPNCRGLL
ncbi:hypothetical protein WJX81_008646 [Elliptochloris bilobata]|uniref:[histone H3]-lysine(4) N-trimethyltransferase n=1 Tax=Elliptochloris bilobata TaxID=381761 RepID=A0AAW1SEF7_9CHLO